MFLSRGYGQLLTTLLLLFLSACESRNEYIAPPAPEVTVSKPIQQSVTDYLEFTGTTQSVGYAEVRARVSGILESMHFFPGVHVEQGDLLFVIDPEPYQAELASARAKLKRAQAELDRADKLIQKNYISKTEHLRHSTERDVAQSAIGLKAARVRSAEIQMEYTQVMAPISGRVGRNLVDVGNLVGEGEATLLTEVS
ncbi:efflux RND transporter periplasmic adaptor subunit [Bathymodiolus japonicus methanotrophic gill symbiont]|uniref:efflux RND transporter periplasmic adaptor subunit n=1 Tax=Bathymodiolus japonicus methanotrophic gill symbiont TaxID=113269 RepID=UPI001C8D6443|nr:efflux RND transporter periplasmic adaptor subunit [Bathymodiolus japonicus methanotrophic gill symbiont]